MTHGHPCGGGGGGGGGKAAAPERGPERSAAMAAPRSRRLGWGLDKLSFSKGSDLDRILTCLQALEGLWAPSESGAPPEKEKHLKAARILGDCFSSVENPWEAAVNLTRTVRDYGTAKTSCLAYFCMRTFSK